MTSRLITFLGKTHYDNTTYVYKDRRQETCYVAQALGMFLKPQEVHVFATPEAWNKHGNALTQAFSSAGLVEPTFKEIGAGTSPDDLWDQFRKMLDSFQTQGTVAFDITHGFRAQPFFASAVIQFFQSIEQTPSELRVFYGAYEARNEETNDTPIWDLTVFVELLRWSRAVLLCLRTGQAEGIAEPTERLGNELKKQWALNGQQGPQPSLARLGKALREFGDAFTTVRTGSLLSEQPSVSQRLLEALQEAGHDVTRFLPPLAFVLKKLMTLVEPLAGSPRLSDSRGQEALQALAKTYLSMGRYAEAAAILREGWITRYACALADCPGSERFSDAHRQAAEKLWQEQDPDMARTLAEVRNDIEHAGFRAHPKPPQTIKQQLERLIEQWCLLDAVQCPTEISRDNPDADWEQPIFYRIGVDQPIMPDEPLPLLPDIPRGALVVVEGRAPIWRYGMAFHRLHGSPAGAVAVYDPRLGAVVIASHHPKWREGQVLDVSPPMA